MSRRQEKDPRNRISVRKLPQIDIYAREPHNRWEPLEVCDFSGYVVLTLRNRLGRENGAAVQTGPPDYPPESRFKCSKK
jgi:hypothetical protein